MSLPRAIQEEYKKLEETFGNIFDSANSNKEIFLFLKSIIEPAISEEVFKNKEKLYKKRIISVVLSLMKSFLRKEHITYLKKQDYLTKVYFEKYQGLEKNTLGNLVPVRRKVKVSSFIIEKLKEIDEKKLEQDRKEHELKTEILKYQNRTFDSRNFPAKLKQIIFQRDNYTCCICGRRRDDLIRANLHLEIDHITPWLDGGKTCYENGQTLCSECNKGKHHARRIVDGKNSLNC